MSTDEGVAVVSQAKISPDTHSPASRGAAAKAQSPGVLPGRQRRLRGKLELFVVPLVLLGCWEVVGVAVGRATVAPPAETMRTVAQGFSEGWLSGALLHTLYATALATLIATAAGLWLGFMLGMSTYWGRVFEGPLFWIYAIPKVTLFPVFLLFIGLNINTEIAFGAFQGVFPLVLILMSAIRSIPRVFLKVRQVYRLGQWDTFIRIVVPDTLPALVTGVRYCFSLSFLGVVLAEMFAAKAGAGYVLMQGLNLNRVSWVFAVVLILVVVALVINALFVVLQNHVGRRREVAT